MNDQDENLILHLSMDAINQMLETKLTEQRAHFDARIAKLEGMITMLAAARHSVAPVQTTPTQPAAPVTQVPVYRDPFLVALYQPGAYPGWMCKYQDDLAHPVLTVDQLARVKEEGKLGEKGGKPAISRDLVAKYEAENKDEIARLMNSLQVWSATAQARTPAVPTPAVPAAPPIPEFNDNIPDFA